MSWEEHLLTDEEIKDIFLEYYTKQWGKEVAKELLEQLPEFNYSKALTKAQAEKSYKAGQRSIIEWIQSLNPNYPDIPIGIAFTPWEAYLKKEGIE